MLPTGLYHTTAAFACHTAWETTDRQTDRPTRKHVRVCVCRWQMKWTHYCRWFVINYSWQTHKASTHHLLAAGYSPASRLIVSITNTRSPFLPQTVRGRRAWWSLTTTPRNSSVSKSQKENITRASVDECYKCYDDDYQNAGRRATWALYTWSKQRIDFPTDDYIIGNIL